MDRGNRPVVMCEKGRGRDCGSAGFSRARNIWGGAGERDAHEIWIAAQNHQAERQAIRHALARVGPEQLPFGWRRGAQPNLPGRVAGGESAINLCGRLERGQFWFPFLRTVRQGDRPPCHFSPIELGRTATSFA